MPFPTRLQKLVRRLRSFHTHGPCSPPIKVRCSSPRGSMPEFVSYAPMIYAPTPKQGLFDPTLEAAYAEMQYMEAEKFSSLFYALQNSEQLLTPPASPAPDCGSPFDYVPYEILDQIIGCLHSDTSRDIYDVLRDVSACRLVSRQFNSVATNWLYRHVPISDPYAFTKVTPLLALADVQSFHLSFHSSLPRDSLCGPSISARSPSSHSDEVAMITETLKWSCPRPSSTVSNNSPIFRRFVQCYSVLTRSFF
jgi:F-box-like